MQGQRWQVIQKHLALIGAVVIGITLTVGCGGSGGVTAPIVPPNGIIRQLRVGDLFVYRVSGSIRNIETGETISVSGQLRSEVVGLKKDPEGRDYLVNQTTYILQANGRTLTLLYSTFFRQDQDGNIYKRGERIISGERWIVSPTPEVISTLSPLQIGQTHTYDIIYSDGNREISTYRVDAVEQVKVPAGTFTAFKISQQTQTQGESSILSAATKWVVPQIGAPIKMSGTSTDYTEGYSYILSAEMTAYSLP